MPPTLSAVDIAIVVVYLVAIVGMSYAFAWRQHDGEDYLPSPAMKAARSRRMALTVAGNSAMWGGLCVG